MNKKKLSVVMAGAMLASSVSPVLAATESTVDQNELGSLVVKVYDKLTGTLYTDNGNSVYEVRVDGKRIVQTEKETDLKTDANKKALRLALQEEFKKLTAGQKVEIYSLGFRTDAKGDIVDTENVVDKYEADDFDTAGTSGTLATEIQSALTTGSNANLVDTGAVNVTKDTNAVITFKADVDLTALGAKGYTVDNAAHTLTIKVGDPVLDFSQVETKDGNVYKIDANTPGAKGSSVSATVKCLVTDVKGFPVKEVADDIEGKLEETITVTGEENNFKTEDLYDGLMLTTKGHDFLSLIKAADKKTGYNVTFKQLNGNNITGSSTALVEHKSEYGFVVEITNKSNKTTKYTVKGNQKDTQRVFNWMYDRLAKVDILAGDNRYETAVSVAREQLGMAKGLLGASDSDDTTTVSNIVLVNGGSLVDGLAAAPLAASLEADKDHTGTAAPILLTKADELPAATKAFLKELLNNKVIGNVDTTIHLVGGTSVLSRDLEKELRSYGFKIERYNGANREETSLEVAEAIEKVNGSTSERFVVGAEGEADAMSIAPVAANDETPIIVAKKGGVSYNALDELDGKDVTVIGGEASVSKEDYEAIEEATGDNGSVERVFGDDRQATNAAIIKKYYYSASQVENGLNVKSVIVSKDGRGNKEELVDALTVANLAVQKKAPIVLAKNSLSAAQTDALNLRAKESETLYQVGIGVSRDNVIAPIAKLLGLSNLK